MSRTLKVIVTRQAGGIGEPHKEEYDVELTERLSVIEILNKVNEQIAEKLKAAMMAQGASPDGAGAGEGAPAGGPDGAGAGPVDGPGAGEPLPQPLVFPHSCQVRKCGACAMVINGIPRLGCGTFSDEIEGNTLTVEPLSKFPVLHDLCVDKTAIDDMLQEMEVWQHEKPQHNQKTYLSRFDSARCLQCGCCMEVCSNYTPGGKFAGPTAISNTARIVDEIHDKKIRKDYAQICRKHITNKCSQNLTCVDVCPMNIDLTAMLAGLNRL